MLSIARFNWPFYAIALAVLIAASVAVRALNGPLQFLAAAAGAGAAYFIFISLTVSHLIYDRSDLYRWSWLHQALQGISFRRAVFCHCGFDECSNALRAKFPDVHWTVLDHYDAKRMTEPSIRRARALYPPSAGTLGCAYNAWPLSVGTADVVIALLAIHEFRTDPERSAWFAEARRCLRQEGRIVLVEHIRDLPNFIAFGPGFLHFHSRATWQRSWEEAGLICPNQFKVTPFVRVFILQSK
jgi:SAM-dependent methyltransferase